MGAPAWNAGGTRVQIPPARSNKVDNFIMLDNITDDEEVAPSGEAVKSTHRVEVVRIPEITKHPNADTLGIVKIWGGYPVIVRLGEFQEGDLAAYIPPDSIVPEKPEWNFLKGHRRIRAIKLRGQISVGLLIAAPSGSTEGDDLASQLEITHYNPQVKYSSSARIREEETSPPRGYYPVYDLESLRRYTRILELGEEVVVTEKIHGQNCRIAQVDNEIFISSHYRWKKWSPDSHWWGILTEAIAKGILSLPSGSCLYGELYGPVQALRYGLTTPQFRLFDVWTTGEWMCYDSMVAHANQWAIPCVPELYRGPFDLDHVLNLAEGQSVLPDADHIREGCVVRPVIERIQKPVGRVVLKTVGHGYWIRKDL